MIWCVLTTVFSCHRMMKSYKSIIGISAAVICASVSASVTNEYKEPQLGSSPNISSGLLKQNALVIDLDGSIKLYTEEIRQNPDFAEAYFNRGSLFVAKEELNRAIGDFTESILLKPDYTNAFIARGVAYIENDDFNAAIADLDAALKLCPSNSIALLNRGIAYAAKQDYDEAISNYSVAITFCATDARYYYNRGQAFGKKREWDKAINDFTKAIQLQPNFANAYYDRGFTYANIGDYDASIPDYGKAIELCPTNVIFYYSRGLIYESRHGWEAALADFKSATNVDTNYMPALNEMGWLYATCPDKAFRDGLGAMVVAEKACLLTGWENATCIDTLAAANAETGNFRDAVKYELQALSLVGSKDNLRSDMEGRLHKYQEKINSTQQPKHKS